MTTTHTTPDTTPAGSTANPALLVVRVRDQSAESPWGSGPTNPIVRTIRISPTCPVCSGPRGAPRNLNQCDDGAHYSVDVWDNPCGHVDSYTTVVAEARQLAATTAATEGTGPER